MEQVKGALFKLYDDYVAFNGQIMKTGTDKPMMIASKCIYT